MAVTSKISVSVHIPTVNQRFDPFVEQEMRPFEGPNGCEVPGELLIGVGTK